MRQRVMIAMALALNPKVLIADEPTTALDVTVQAQIMDLLADLRRELDMAMILITHDLGVVADVADRIAVMYAGRIVEHADVHALYAAPAHPYTKALLESIPRLHQSGQPLTTIKGLPPNLMRIPSGCPFHPRCRYTQDICTTEVPAVRQPRGRAYERLPLRARGARWPPLRSRGDAARGDPILQVEQLVKHFPLTQGVVLRKQVGAVKAVDGLSFELRRGETLGVVGESGCGKSTLARLLMRLETPTAGRALSTDGTSSSCPAPSCADSAATSRW